MDISYRKMYRITFLPSINCTVNPIPFWFHLPKKRKHYIAKETIKWQKKHLIAVVLVEYYIAVEERETAIFSKLK